MVAAHHIDCPWKPSDIEQREGRIIRQGNENEEVNIYRYVTKGSFDAYLWGIVETKQRFISQVFTSRELARICEDIDETVLNFAEIKAVASENPLIMEKIQVDNEVARLRILKAAHEGKRFALQDAVTFSTRKGYKVWRKNCNRFKWIWTVGTRLWKYSRGLQSRCREKSMRSIKKQGKSCVGL